MAQELLKEREQARQAEEAQRLEKLAAQEASAQARHAVANAEVASATTSRPSTHDCQCYAQSNYGEDLRDARARG